MQLQVHRLHPLFAGEVTGLDLRMVVDAPALKAIRAAMDNYAVLVFRDQGFEDDEQIAFAERFDGAVHTKTGRGAIEKKSRLGSRGITDISNLDENGEILESNDRRRMRALGNRLWHTDASFTDPPGRYSMLSARGGLPPSGGETEYADLRAGYEALPDELKRQIQGLRAHHSIVYSRETIGFTAFTEAEHAALPGADHPLVRVHAGSQRHHLYLASHASHVLGWPVPEGRILLRELIVLATRPQFVYRHQWRLGDFVIWDNRCTMHRGLAFDESFARDLRRVTTLDVVTAPSRAAVSA